MTDLLILASSACCLAAVVIGSACLGPLYQMARNRFLSDLILRLRSLGLDGNDVDRYLRYWLGAVGGVIVLFGFVWPMVPVAAGLVAVLLVAPRYVTRLIIDRRQIALRDQLVDAATALANTSRAGLALAQGFDVVARETPAPLSSELRRVVRDYEAGRPLADAIREVQARLRLDAFNLFATAVLTCLERGGRVTQALESIAGGLRELQRLERKLEADTAAGRRIAWILGLFPLAFLVGFGLLDPTFIGIMFSTLLGQFTLLMVGVVVFAAVWWCQRILDLDL